MKNFENYLNKIFTESPEGLDLEILLGEEWEDAIEGMCDKINDVIDEEGRMDSKDHKVIFNAVIKAYKKRYLK